MGRSLPARVVVRRLNLLRRFFGLGISRKSSGAWPAHIGNLEEFPRQCIVTMALTVCEEPCDERLFRAADCLSSSKKTSVEAGLPGVVLPCCKVTFPVNRSD